MRYTIHIKSLLSVLLLIFALLFSTSIYAKKPVGATPIVKDSLTKSSPSKPEAGIDAQTIDKNSVSQVEQALVLKVKVKIIRNLISQLPKKG